ncbi:hypothetical protein [Streptomyces sp. NPDC004135]
MIESARAGIPVAVATLLDHPRPEAVGAHVVVRALADAYAPST